MSYVKDSKSDVNFLGLPVTRNRPLCYISVTVGLQWSCADGLGIYYRRTIRNNGYCVMSWLCSSCLCLPCHCSCLGVGLIWLMGVGILCQESSSPARNRSPSFRWNGFCACASLL